MFLEHTNKFENKRKEGIGMTKKTKSGVALLMAMALVTGMSTNALAAGKTVNAYKNNTYDSRGSDAKNFYDHVKAYSSGYSGSYKYGNDVSNSDFLSKSSTIKYWASHGRNNGSVYGDANSVDVRLSDGFKFSGGNLEFLFLASCYQLTGAGDNPRARYANSMIGDKAVRVICGYHEQAPKVGDTIVEKYFFNNPDSGSNDVRDGESVKSAWMKANIRANSVDGYSAPKNFLVLTHNNSSQYSRFEGYSSTTYARPNSSTSILRFSMTNQGGVNQPYSINEADKNEKLTSLEVPNYTLKVQEVSAAPSLEIGGEIGDKKVSFNEETAIQKSRNWFDTAFDSIALNSLKDNDVKVSPIVMAEVLEDSSKEVEVPVAYVVEQKNYHNGIRLAGDTYTTIVDDEGIKSSTFVWHQVVSENPVTTMKSSTIDYGKAVNLIKEKMIASKTTMSAISAQDRQTIQNCELLFVQAENSDIFRPSWVFETGDSVFYTVDCLDGTVSER